MIWLLYFYVFSWVNPCSYVDVKQISLLLFIIALRFRKFKFKLTFEHHLDEYILLLVFL